MKNGFQPKADTAFSLVEVVVALGIFAFSILTIIGLMGSSLKVTRDNEERIQAANVATVLMERYREMINQEVRRAAGRQADAISWNNFPLPANPAGGNSFSSSVQWIDNVGAVTSREEAAFGLKHLITSEPVKGSAAQLVRCSLQLIWPVESADKDSPQKNTYVATTAFVANPW
jgi:Tfp pilus assembly protein PilV